MSRLRYMFLYSGGLFFELASVIVIFVVIGVLVNYFLFAIIPIQGQSMEPNFDSGDWALVNKSSYIKNEPRRGDVVGLKFPGDPNREKYIKRVIGLPGENVTISGGKVYINSVQLVEKYIPDSVMTIPDLSVDLKNDQYYMVGDNRENSSDSRIWGPATKKELIGKAMYVLYPFSHYKYVGQPLYFDK